MDNYYTPEKSIIENALEACIYVCWKFADLIRNDSKNGNGDELIDYSINIISSFKKVLPKLIDWSVQLEEITLAESFFPVYIGIMTDLKKFF